MNIHQNIYDLRGAIEALLLEYPELAEDEVLRADTFAGETNMEETLSQLVEMISDADSMVEAIKSRIAALSERKARFERREDALRSLAKGLLEKADLRKFVLPEATVSLSYRAPAPVITNEAAIPDDFCKFKRSPDIKKIKEAYADGKSVDGTALGNFSHSLTIRFK